MILDVRTPEEYAEDRLPEAVLLPLDELMAQSEAAHEILSRAMTRQGGKAAPLYVHCASGGRAGMACMLLKQMGFERVENLGGIEEARDRISR